MSGALNFTLDADEQELFLQEVNEHLQQMEQGILGMEQGLDQETLNLVFRAAHTLKAVAGTVGHHSMAELTHALETIFDGMREGVVELSQAGADVLLETLDALRALRDEVISREPSGVDVEAQLAQLAQLEQAQPLGQPGASAGELSQPAGERKLDAEQVALAESYQRTGYALVELLVRADMSSFAPGARLLQAALLAAENGVVLAQQPSESELLEDRHDGSLWLLLATQLQPEELVQQLGQIFELGGVEARPFAVSPEGRGARRSPRLRAAADKTVRINVERLDLLMDLVGELVTDRTRLVQIERMLQARYGKDEQFSALSGTLTHLGRVIGQLQNEVMQARMLPIAQLFDKFPRLVRDISRQAGKQVSLQIDGEATELDRSVMEALSDPLIHLLRNAIDHGIEAPAARVAAGKPPEGTISLNAEHVEGQVVITIRDDGQGIDPQRVRRSVVRRGLLTEEEALRLSDDETRALLFQPGISTAETVSETSGRGVGLDVVQTNIGRIGGFVVVESEPGRGTTFRVTLPLTLAIMQTMLVALGEDVYALPMRNIVESLYLADVLPGTVKGRPAIVWRDQVLPLLGLREFFYNPGRTAPEQGGKKQAIVVVSWGKLQAGLVVDRIIGKQEIVVKPFGSIVGSVSGLSGCTIMGDGHVALIVDVPGLINEAVQTHRREVSA